LGALIAHAAGIAAGTASNNHTAIALARIQKFPPDTGSQTATYQSVTEITRPRYVRQMKFDAGEPAE
jgi:hypothetical protein